MARTRPLAGLALLASSLIFTLGLAEYLLRLLPNLEQAPKKYRDVAGGPFHGWDPLLGWRTVPDRRAALQSVEYKISVHNNSRGIRGPEYSYTPDPNEYRVLVIGDSFTTGYTVPFEETFGQIVQRNLNAHASQKHTVIAAGTEAYSTDQEFLFSSKRVEVSTGYHRANVFLVTFGSMHRVLEGLILEASLFSNWKERNWFLFTRLSPCSHNAACGRGDAARQSVSTIPHSRASERIR